MSGFSAQWAEPTPPPLPEFDGVIEPVVQRRIDEMQALVAQCDAALADRTRLGEHHGARQRRQYATNEIKVLSRGRPVKS